VTTEWNKGKARTTMPRSSDARASTADERPRQRDGNGRFLPGNRGGLGRGAIAPIRRMLGSVETSDAEASTVARDAARVFADALRDLPSDGPVVRQLVALYARHVALSGFWSARSSRAGLGSEEGVAAGEQATKHGVRAERLAVTMTDLARAAVKKKNEPFDLGAALNEGTTP
jgi:hypothetical protein